MTSTNSILRLVINLDSSLDRLEWMKDAFEDLGLDFVRVPASSPETFGDIDDCVLMPNGLGVEWTAGEIGCFLSHRQCWKRAAVAEEDFTAIFEDDLHFAPGAKKLLRTAEWIPGGIELLRFETTLQKVMLSTTAKKVDEFNIHELRSKHWGTGGYLISRSGAIKLISRSHEIRWPVDIFMFDPVRVKNDLTSWQINPAICIQDSVLFSEAARFSPTIVRPGKVARRLEKPRGKAKFQSEISRPFRRFAEKLGRIVRRESQHVVPLKNQQNLASDKRRQTSLCPPHRKIAPCSQKD
ncbi:glycosyltransferase family 25 protein [Mesorhizobium sp. ZMM04-5]|uniref:Glycosyltransferase family 25 protein n=1 Tax=Mesorhizobium marinum TaxID=3228790 RepID=A0ABV3R090_9HYPH